MQCHGQWCRLMSVEDVVRGSGKGLLINLLTSHNMTNTKSPTTTTSIATEGLVGVGKSRLIKHCDLIIHEQGDGNAI